ncbi:MAG: fructosamine kinase family protein [Bacteroidia bacterium]
MLSKELKIEIENRLSVTIQNTKPVSGGCINEAQKLETNSGNYFLKINSANAFPGMFEAEAKGLQILSVANEITVPAVIYTGEFQNSSYLILEWIESGRRSKNFFESFGRNLARLHKHKNGFFGLNHDNYIGSLPQLNKQYENGVDFFIEQRLMKQIELAEKNNAINNSVIQQFDNLFKKLAEIIPDEKPALLHGDLWSGNYMTGNNGEACIIDPAVYYGYREADLAMTKLFGGFDAAFYESYNEEFPLQKGWQQRLDIFNLYPLMVHVNLFGGGYLEQVKMILKSLP